jgi:hypothetical protein
MKTRRGFLASALALGSAARLVSAARAGDGDAANRFDVIFHRLAHGQPVC